MFGIPGQTAFDLRFRLLGVNVRVHPMHWAVSALLGYSFYSDPGYLLYLPVWLLAVFVSVLLHEMGHVMTGRLFGSDGHILLYSFGGLAIGSSDLRNRWQRILVIAAGPGIQLVFFGLLLVSDFFLVPLVPPAWREPVAYTFTMLLIINLVWPLFNLLPLWPLDGGRITREILEGWLGQRGVIVSLWVSIILAGALAAQIVMNIAHIHLIPRLYTGWLGTSIFNALFLAYFCVLGVQTLQAEQARFSRFDDELPWER